MATLNASDIITALGLRPLPMEGGYFSETYRSSLVLGSEALPRDYSGPRSAATAIYYLLTPDTFSALHRLPGDEIYHFYLGDPIEMLQLQEGSGGRLLRLGSGLGAGMRPQAVVSAGVWQGSRLLPGGRFALLGATMAPGFDFADFEAGSRSRLISGFPQYATQIVALTRA